MTKSKAVQAILCKRRELGSLGLVSRECGIPKGELSNIVSGKRKASPAVKMKLGIVPPVRRRPINWYWKYRLLRRYILQNGRHDGQGSEK